MFYTCCDSELYTGLFFWRRNLSPRSHCRRLSFLDQPAPHPSPLPEERELVVRGAPAFTLAMITRADSFDSSGGVAAIDPSAQPSPRGEGANGDEDENTGHALSTGTNRESGMPGYVA